jgi:hypothetical protein
MSQRGPDVGPGFPAECGDEPPGPDFRSPGAGRYPLTHLSAELTRYSMSKLFTALCATLSLTLTACTGNPPSNSFDSERPAIEVRPGKPSQERGAREFTHNGRPVFLGEPSYFHVAEAWSTTDERGHPAVGIRLTPEDEAAAKQWVVNHVGNNAAILLEGHVLLTGIVQPPSDHPLVIGRGPSGLNASQAKFVVKLLNGEY